MKKIEATIKSFKLGAVRDALAKIGIEEMTVLEAREFGHSTGRTEIYRGSIYAVDFVPMIKLEIMIADGLLDLAIDVILKSAGTGKPENGKVFVTPVEQCQPIRATQELCTHFDCESVRLKPAFAV